MNDVGYGLRSYCKRKKVRTNTDHGGWCRVCMDGLELDGQTIREFGMDGVQESRAEKTVDTD